MKLIFKQLCVQMDENGSLTILLLHVIFHGLPGAGKSCAKWKLTGQKLHNLKPATRKGDTVCYPTGDARCSTGVAEKYHLGDDCFNCHH